MSTQTIAELRKELKHQSEEELIKLCLRLAQYKKENKELLNYLLFDAGKEEKYVARVKEEITAGFDTLNTSSFYLAKKTIRKVLRLVKKHIKYSGKVETEIELLLYYCQALRKTKIKFEDSKVLANLFERQKEAITKAYFKLHEDIQYDYNGQLKALGIIV